MLAGYIDWCRLSENTMTSPIWKLIEDDNNDWTVWASEFELLSELSSYIRENPNDAHVEIGVNQLKSIDPDCLNKAWLGWHQEYWGTDECFLHCHGGEIMLSEQQFGLWNMDFRFDTFRENEIICGALCLRFPDLHFRSVSCTFRFGTADLMLAHKGEEHHWYSPISDVLLQNEFNLRLSRRQAEASSHKFMEAFPLSYFLPN
jgi:hypothetical protein